MEDGGEAVLQAKNVCREKAQKDAKKDRGQKNGGRLTQTCSEPRTLDFELTGKVTLSPLWTCEPVRNQRSRAFFEVLPVRSPVRSRADVRNQSEP
jgi:hypothetical protein